MSSPNEFLPPMIDGVSASQVYLPPQKDTQTIYEYLCGHFAHIRTDEWKQRFQDGLVYAANGDKLTLTSPYVSNTHIFYYRFLAYEPHVPFEHRILFENDDLLVVDKPHFLTISPTGQYVQETLLVRLKKQTGNEFLTPIHRLDRETAGVVLFCKRVESRGLYQQLFAERQVNKIYNAVAPYKKDLNFPQTLHLHLDKGHPFYTMQVIENAKANTQTYIELIEHDQIWAKYRLTPTTGKQHQLRVHLNYLSIPIKNDPFYPIVQHKAEDDFSEPLQLLAKHISFIDPLTKEGMSFNSEFELTL